MRLGEVRSKWHIFAIQPDMFATLGGQRSPVPSTPPAPPADLSPVWRFLGGYGTLITLWPGEDFFLSGPARWEVPDPREPRSPVSAAAAWAAEVTTIAMEMAAPALAGWWLDRKLDTSPLCVSMGGGIGLALGLLHLVRLSSRKGGNRPGGHDTDCPEHRRTDVL